MNKQGQYTTYEEILAGYNEIPTNERSPFIEGYIEQLAENGLIVDELLKTL